MIKANILTTFCGHGKPQHEITIEYLGDDESFIPELVDVLNEAGLRSCVYTIECVKPTEQ